MMQRLTVFLDVMGTEAGDMGGYGQAVVRAIAKPSDTGGLRCICCEMLAASTCCCVFSSVPSTRLGVPPT